MDDVTIKKNSLKKRLDCIIDIMKWGERPKGYAHRKRPFKNFEKSVIKFPILSLDGSCVVTASFYFLPEKKFWSGLMFAIKQNSSRFSFYLFLGK